jgi:hypothetical protein
MSQFGQVQGLMHLARRGLFHPDQGHTRPPPARIQFARHGLGHAVVHMLSPPPDDQRGAPIHKYGGR